MSQEKNAQEQASAPVDPFAIFNLKVDEIVTHEEAPARERIDWDELYYEPDPDKGKNGVYQAIVKLLPNINDPIHSIQRKRSYKLLNPNNPQKTFTYDSPEPIDWDDQVVRKWLDNRHSQDVRLKAAAAQLKSKNKAAVVIQIIKDTNRPELEGQLRILRISGGQEVDVLIKSKISPTPEDIEMGKKAENIFDPFFSRYLLVKVTKDANGRSWAETTWSDSEMKAGMKIMNAEGKWVIINKDDATNPDIQKKIIEMLSDPKVSLSEHFAIKPDVDGKRKEFVAKALRVMFGEEAPSLPGTNAAPPASTPAASAPPASAPAQNSTGTPPVEASAPILTGTPPVTAPVTTSETAAKTEVKEEVKESKTDQSTEDFLAGLGLNKS